MFPLRPGTPFDGKLEPVQEQMLVLGEDCGAEPAGAQAAQVTTGGCRCRRPLWPRLSPAPVPSPLVFRVPGFARPCPRSPEAPLPTLGWKGDSGHSPVSPLRLWQLGTARPSCCFTNNIPTMTFSTKANLRVLFQRHFPVPCPEPALPLVLAELRGLFPARSCGISIRPR